MGRRGSVGRRWAFVAALTTRGLVGEVSAQRPPELAVGAGPAKDTTGSRRAVGDAGGTPWEGKSPAQTLRWLRWRKRRDVRELLTDVLDPHRLAAEEALALYPWRWKIERLFFDLKEVLNLHRLYLSSPNGMAMQVVCSGHRAYGVPRRPRTGSRGGGECPRRDCARQILSAAGRGVHRADGGGAGICDGPSGQSWRARAETQLARVSLCLDHPGDHPGCTAQGTTEETALLSKSQTLEILYAYPWGKN